MARRRQRSGVALDDDRHAPSSRAVALTARDFMRQSTTDADQPAGLLAMDGQTMDAQGDAS
jgi:hypothetical protein